MLTRRKVFLFCSVFTGFVVLGFTYLKICPPPVEDTIKMPSTKQKHRPKNTPEIPSRSFFKTPDPSADFAPDDGYESKYGARPHSLRDTRIDGELIVDHDGHLVISPGIRRMFDYFLSAAGEEPFETIIGRIEEYIDHMIPLAAAAEAKKILDSYLLYKQGLFALEKNYPALNHQDPLTIDRFLKIEDVLNQRRDIRRKYLPAGVVDAFFGDEEAYEQFTIERLIIQNNDDLSIEEKSSAMADLQNKFPDETTNDYLIHEEYQAIRSEINTLQNQGGRQEEIYEIRKTTFGKDAADRLTALDEKRVLWRSRVDEYSSKKEKIMNAPNFSDEEKQQRVDDLRQTSFTVRERLRLDVILKNQDRK